ncbi:MULTISPECIES: competence type IV pilus major pilin ComGC [Lysinibacillus]|uniref:competence type IV pilus major pilin ComGC n=1 Tax=Lysinibacillus TaxID=400634 RepID=UPI00088F41E3|nr:MULTISPECIES: competence type IV pilus major pilin ComGC [unclassified Lysinibacillus]MEE3805989.1 competence type IV pilus major pilin ComGC [Lysinibacillus fusiformis]SCZ09352.1 competence protein ComGC [Lysinibacillus sp. SG9]SDB54370.1 competence protein ComGC [Lysinibacillus sp. TC-37]SFT18360.1 competence protein ComGC [Lysinibacillus sp. SG55]
MKRINEQAGFTLIEMLIVLLIISILILITIPNVTKHFATIDEKGCKAYISMVQGQVEAYRVDFMTYPTLDDLVVKGYLKEHETTCPNKAEIVITNEGEVRLANADLETGSNS